MPIVDDKAWHRFLECPLAELEGHGMPIRFIRPLEENYGLYIKDIHAVSAVDVQECARNFGKRGRIQLTKSLQSLWKEIQSGDI